MDTITVHLTTDEVRRLIAAQDAADDTARFQAVQTSGEPPIPFVPRTQHRVPLDPEYVKRLVAEHRDALELLRPHDGPSLAYVLSRPERQAQECAAAGTLIFGRGDR